MKTKFKELEERQNELYSKLKDILEDDIELVREYADIELRLESYCNQQAYENKRNNLHNLWW